MSTWIRTRQLEVVCPPTEVWDTLRKWHGQVRLVHNLTLEACSREGKLPALQKSPKHPEALLGRVDKGGTPLWVHRTGVVAGRAAQGTRGALNRPGFPGDYNR